MTHTLRRMTGLGLALLSALALAAAPLGLMAEEPARAAFLHSPNGQAVALCNTADDYEFPAAVYFDGVRVKVHEVGKGIGAFPQAIDDPQQRWAYVSIEAEDGAHRLSGWTVNAALQYEGETGLSPGTLPEGSLAEQTALRLDNGLSEQTIASYPAGTRAQVLGMMRDWWQVRIEGRTGFVKPGALRFDEAAQQLIDAAQPPYGFEEVGLGHRERYMEYLRQRDALMGGEPMEAAYLDLETRAKVSALAESYGFDYLDFINDLPGPGDLSQAEAEQKGWEALQAHFGIDHSQIGGLSSFFFHWPEEPEARYWRVTAQTLGPVPYVSVDMSAAGELLSFDQGQASGGDWEGMSRDSVLYYSVHQEQAEPPADALSRERAEELAWQRFLQTVPGSAREDFRLLSASFHQMEDEQRSWWMVRITEKDSDLYAPVWEAAVFLPEGGEIISSDGRGFADDLAQGRHLREQAALEAARGPFEVWSKEEKAEAYPDIYRLPAEGDMSEEKAIALAREAIRKHLYASDEALDGLRLVTALTTQGIWRVEYYEHELQDGQAVCRFAAALYADTGEVIEVVAGAPIGNG